MATLQASGIADLISTSLDELGELKMTDLMSTYNKTIAMKRTIKKGKMTFQAGPNVDFNVITGTNNSARFVGLYEQDNVNVTDVMTTGTAPWRHVNWNWAIDRREVAMNRSPRKIVDLTQSRRLAAAGSAVELFEQKFWRGPASTDTTNPLGMPHWIVKNNTEGFNGAAPSGYTTVGGLNPSTYTRWKNYTAQYTAVTFDDFVRKVRKGMWETDFEPLVEDIPTYNTGNDLAMYCNYALGSVLEELLLTQNDDLGPDLASMDGKVMFRRVPVQILKVLEDDTTNPMYLINWGEMHAAGLSGEWMYETRIDKVSNQHTVAAVHTDCTMNWFTRNRRRHAVFATDTTMPS